MKLSQLPPKEIRSLAPEQINAIVFGDLRDDGGSADVALLLGGNPIVLPGRCQAAASLYASGRVPYIIPTGGVIWDTPRGRLSEAEYMAALLMDLGVPESAVFVESEARTTVENLLFSSIVMERRLKLRNVRRLCVVTSPSHLRRSLEYAQRYLPPILEVFGYGDPSLPDGPDRWTEDPFYADRVVREAELLQKAILSGLMADIEF